MEIHATKNSSIDITKYQSPDSFLLGLKGFFEGGYQSSPQDGITFLNRIGGIILCRSINTLPDSTYLRRLSHKGLVLSLEKCDQEWLYATFNNNSNNNDFIATYINRWTWPMYSVCKLDHATGSFYSELHLRIPFLRAKTRSKIKTFL